MQGAATIHSQRDKPVGKALIIRSIMALAIAVGSLQVSRADMVAVELDTATGFAGWTMSVPLIGGWEFTPTVDVEVTSLGIFDWDGNGDGLVTSHDVAIWDKSNTATPVISATIPAGTAADSFATAPGGGFRFEDVATTQLDSGTTYVIAAYYPEMQEEWIASPGNSTFTAAPEIGMDVNTWRVELDSPNLVYPTSADASGAGFGPNFTITAIPEPSAFAFLGLIGLMAGGRCWCSSRFRR